ncbi:hypothetical protein CO180_01885 [candidate division WWE3 bacterium CG_4_9_14_3_um_filter_41_6]|uniref:Uncharacterized protein n=1 Tax=candidate division WWE3 bacterium CG_4_10_14_0_2_um_filter_41_14 TaxID=1975072 RepID=A0A2M7TF77_UNCKA|nr:MAG: hypothetical protein COY32_06350 [candidate division WWE3 bacterium CG_4_10_14_0_2_um_filter_41_14]PJA38960.1 MAG: hypothetical protein CO180_01885 [candidate division WWE3 bacterium CG_4_9_14_3_um_filter_41_6]
MFEKIVFHITSGKTDGLSINGDKKTVAAAAQYRSTNTPNDPFIKVLFTDSSGLILLLHDEQIYYSQKKIGHLRHISNSAIGSAGYVEYEDRKFLLANKGDYQFVENVLIGSPNDIEGECRFSDYISRDNKHILSLAVNSYTGKRDDVYATLIDESAVVVKK